MSLCIFKLSSLCAIHMKHSNIPASTGGTRFRLRLRGGAPRRLSPHALHAVGMAQILHLLIGSTLIAFATAASAVDKCGDQTSKGNPLPCCNNGGNCTWWAWRHAKQAGWPVTAIPTGHANTWDEFARAHTKYLNVSTIPSVGAVGVKNSSPYECGTRKKPKKCDFGHVGVATSLVKDKKGKVTHVTTSQMACDGAYGVTTPKRAVGYYDYYITKK